MVERPVLDEVPVPARHRLAVEGDAEPRAVGHRHDVAALAERAAFDHVGDLPAEQRLARLGIQGIAAETCR